MAFNQLTDAEAERLAILSEECAEVIQAVAKIQRHGYNSHHPTLLTNNRLDLEEELGHVRYIMSKMINAGDIKIDNIVNSQSRKVTRQTNYLHHQD